MNSKRYSIVVRGELDAATLERLGEPEAHPGAGRTELVSDVVDQAQLMGLLTGLTGVGVEVISAAPLDS